MGIKLSRSPSTIGLSTFELISLFINSKLDMFGNE